MIDIYNYLPKPKFKQTFSDITRLVISLMKFIGIKLY